MSILARGSFFLIGSLFLAVFFCFQPRVEANNSSTGDLQTNIYQNNLQENNLTNEFSEIPQTQAPSTILESELNNENNAASSSAGGSRAFRATAYCLQGRTAVGGNVRRGIVAADSRILPLGTRIKIEAGSYSGTYTVADTGGAVKGRVLDVWVPTCTEAMRFGRKNIMVSVLSKNGK